ncbi:MAG: tetratricopeptide repeat protein [Gemmatimonadales bacterium]
MRRKQPRETKSVMRLLLIPMVLTSLLAIALGSLPLMLLGAVVWTFWIAYYILVTKVLLPDGKETPYIVQHSNIEAMEVSGRYAEASAAYRAVILEQPQDLVACEKLGQLALRQLKDYDLALQAYREAERRAVEPRRKLGYAMIVAGIYRDNLKDVGKALVELRRIVALYPEAPNRARLIAEIDELRSVHFEGQ